MGLRSNPSQRQRRLGAELRRLRELSGMSATDAGSLAGLGRAHMSHIEMGRTAIPEEKLRTLAHAYGCNSQELIDALVALGDATGKGWWTQYRDDVSPSTLDLVELEDSASAHRTFQWIYVPGLLQTADYMRALILAGEPETSPAVLDRYVEFRLQRQQVLLGESPPQYHAVIHEAALHMQFIGAESMRRQIEHLTDMARLPHVRIRILPFTAQAYPATFSTPFVIFESPLPELGTVFVEHPLSSPFLGDQEHLAQFSEAIDRLSAAALPALVPGGQSPTHKDSFALVQHLLYLL